MRMVAEKLSVKAGGSRLGRISGGVMTAALVLSSAVAWAQGNVERTARVVSPAGQRSVQVEWDAPIGWGENVEFLGRMVVLVDEGKGGAPRPREIEAPQVRAVQSPVWLDNRWAAFTYNVQKNFNGVVYVDTADATALQVEMIAPQRRMGQSGQVEADLTSLDVTEHGTTGTIRYRNITRGRASVFPLALRPLQLFSGVPYPKTFLDELRGAMAAYREWLSRNGAETLRLELGSESFAPDERHLALLACAVRTEQDETTAAPVLVISPVGAPAPKDAMNATRLIRLDPSVELSCEAGGGGDGGEAVSDPMPATLVRYTTRWKDPRTVAVEREVSDEEREQLESEAVFLVTLDGETTRLAAADKTPEVLQVRQEAEPESEPGNRNIQAGQTSGSRRTGEPEDSSVTRSDTGRRPASKEKAEPRRPARTPAPERPTRTPARRIPTVTTPAPASGQRSATPTPYTAEPIPSLLNRFGGLRGGSDSAPGDSSSPAENSR